MHLVSTVSCLKGKSQLIDFHFSIFNNNSGEYSAYCPLPSSNIEYKVNQLHWRLQPDLQDFVGYEKVIKSEAAKLMRYW